MKAKPETFREGVKEVRLVFDTDGKTINWPDDPKASSGYLPDSHSLWETLWENQECLGGVAHTHPWNGGAWPSGIDVTTWSAIERGLGKRLLWPIVTFTDIKVFEWVGPAATDYAVLREPPILVEDVEDLRNRSRTTGEKP